MGEVSAIETGLALFFLVYGPTIAMVAAVTLTVGAVRALKRRMPIARSLTPRQMSKALLRAVADE